MWWMPPIVVKAGSAFHQRWLLTLDNSNAKGKMAGGKLRPYGSPNVGQELFRCRTRISLSFSLARQGPVPELSPDTAAFLVWNCRLLHIFGAKLAASSNRTWTAAHYAAAYYLVIVA
jgi:hypothetical protein